MRSQIILKLKYLIDNFESIDNVDIMIKQNINNCKYFIIIYTNKKYFTNEKLNKSLLEYFEDLPIQFSIFYDEG